MRSSIPEKYSGAQPAKTTESNIVNIDQLEQLHQYVNQSVDAHRDMSMELVSMENNQVEFILPFQEKHSAHRTNGGLHSGALAAAIDSTCGFVIMLKKTGVQTIATINLRLDHVQGAPAGEDVRIHAQCYQIHNDLAYVSASARDITGDLLLCNAIGIFKLGSIGPDLITEITRDRS